VRAAVGPRTRTGSTIAPTTHGTMVVVRGQTSAEHVPNPTYQASRYAHRSMRTKCNRMIPLKE
jgi:hypothetical protein